MIIYQKILLLVFKMSAIKKILREKLLIAEELPLSRVEVHAKNEISIASVPSGASTGSFEAHELRDNDKNRFFSKGCF